MKQDSLKKNFIFQFLYQVIILIIPLVISAWLTRVLGGEALGIYTFSNSIAFYFILLCNLGILKYGQRIIVARRNDELSLRRTFWSLFTQHSIISIFCILLYVVYCFIFVKDNVNIYLIQTIYVASALFDITWLFYGLENFKSVVIKNVFIKIIECVLIFLLVKNTTDLWIYTLIVSSGFLLGQVIMLPQAIKYIKPIKFTFYDAKEHIKPLLILFISVVATALYTIFDKTLIGLLSSSINDVAYYEYSSKIIQVPRVLLAVVVTVMLPKACDFVEKDDKENHIKIIRLSMVLIAFIGSASTFGLIAISNKLALLYYGEEFAVCGNIIASMTPLILIVYIGEVLRTELLIPQKKDLVYVIGIIISAIVNIVLSIIFIPILGVYGAVLGTTVAEAVGLIYILIICRKDYKILNLLYDIVPLIVIGVVMGAVVYFIDKSFPNEIIYLLLEVLIGAVVFFTLSIFVIFIFYKELWKKVINILMKILRRNNHEKEN